MSVSGSGGREKEKERGRGRESEPVFFRDVVPGWLSKHIQEELVGLKLNKQTGSGGTLQTSALRRQREFRLARAI